MNIEKYAYLLDKDNLVIGNKVFFDLMYHICKTKEIKTKSYIIRNAGLMLQQIFYWSTPNKQGQKKTRYQYNDKGTVKDVVKRDYADWWEDIRLNEDEISSANKLLKQSGLIEIYRMRIKMSDNIERACNCYWLNMKELETGMDAIVEIMEQLYMEKIINLKEQRYQRYLKHKAKDKNLKEKPATLETPEALNILGCNSAALELPTEVTLSTGKLVAATPETGVVKVTPEKGVALTTGETGVTKETPETGVSFINTYPTTDTISYSTDKDNNHNPLYLYSSKDFKIINKKVMESLKGNTTEVSYNTWFEPILSLAYIKDKTIILPCPNEFTKGIIENRHLEKITESYKNIANTSNNINIKLIIKPIEEKIKGDGKS